MSSIPYICLYRSYLYELTGYTDQEVGRLVRALLRYLLDGTTPELTEREHLIWYRLQNQLDRDAEHYDEVCQARSRSAKKRWDKKPILQLYPKAAKENENENEKEKEKENEKEKDSLSYRGRERDAFFSGCFFCQGLLPGGRTDRGGCPAFCGLLQRHRLEMR